VADASRAPCRASQSPRPESDATTRLRVEDRQAQARERQERIRELGEVVQCSCSKWSEQPALYGIHVRFHPEAAKVR
jgi:hypothetical protein